MWWLENLKSHIWFTLFFYWTSGLYCKQKLHHEPNEQNKYDCIIENWWQPSFFKILIFKKIIKEGILGTVDKNVSIILKECLSEAFCVRAFLWPPLGKVFQSWLLELQTSLTGTVEKLTGRYNWDNLSAKVWCFSLSPLMKKT